MHGHGDEGVNIDLNGTVFNFNGRIRDLNSPLNTPKISQDLLQSSKKRTQQRVKYFFSRTLLFDGIHPEDKLAELWLLRFYKFIRKIAEKLISNTVVIF